VLWLSTQLALALLLIWCGCEDSTRPCQLQVPSGRIQGHVRSGGLPLRARIIAEAVLAGSGEQAYYQTDLSDHGAYSLDVPAGLYKLSLRALDSGGTYHYTGAELGYGQIPPDTFLVDDHKSPVEIDFALGGLTLQLDLSSRSDGERGEVFLYRRDDDGTVRYPSYVDHHDIEIEAGRLDFLIAGVLPGEYQVELVLDGRYGDCDCDYGGEHIWLPGTRIRSESPWYVVGADSVTVLECELAAEPARIEGRVSGAWRAMGGSREPMVSLVSPDSLSVRGPHRTAIDGSFSFDIQRPEPVKLLVTQYGVEQWVGGPGFDEATVYPLQSGETISGVEFVQSGVRVLLAATDFFIGTMDFRFHDPADLTLLATASINFEYDHHLSIPNLWPGDFLLFVCPEGQWQGRYDWRTQWLDRVNDPEQAQLITIAAEGDIVPINLTLECGGVITGRLEGGEEAVSSYCILVTSAGEKTLWGHSDTWASGLEYEILGLPDGDFKIGAVPRYPGETQPDPSLAGVVWYPDTIDWDAAGVIEIQEAARVTDVVIVMP